MKIVKLSFTKNELLAVLTSHTGFHVEDFDISDWVSPTLPLHEQILEKIEREAGTILTKEMLNDTKIRFIKALRTVVPGMGLREAKWGIENWNDWISFVAKHNRIPLIMFPDVSNGFEFTKLA